ncbi:MAG: hypothetical protein LBV72_10000 [Tannerella sp.]|jgi:hypothetical protein|nr:hypothetical protein [Tannerella sp.]
MKKLHILFAAIAILFGSCSNDEIITEQPERKGSAPQLIATVEQESVTTKSGVIEDNDYTLGEKFYWNNGDATTVLFRSPSMSNISQYKKAEYAAEVLAGVQSSSAAFNVVQADIIDNGEYTVYGFFPASAWKFVGNPMINMPANQTQNEANSTHLGAYMPMKATNNVAVDGISPINLSYKHLGSVIRFAVWNNSDNNDLKLANINVRLSSGKAVFATQGDLHINETSLTYYALDMMVPALSLQLTGGAQYFATKEGKNQCEGYMAVLPTAANAFESSDDLIIELSFTDGTNNYLTSKTYNIGTDLDFLSNGIEQGKSYYFRLKVDNSDLNAVGTSYALGDYWPDDDNPEGIVFWVKPGSWGTQGKVVGLGEIPVPSWKWGLNNDEQAAGIAGIRSYTAGVLATKSMIANYKDSPTFSTDYPPFQYIYTVINNSNENGPWYLPARDELKMLFAGYSGKVYDPWMSSMPDFDSAECAAARTAFNAKITAIGGKAIGVTSDSFFGFYLSSTEASSDRFFYISLLDSSTGTSPKGNAWGMNFRWIRDF